MKKSPLSTPSGSRASRNYGWKSHENTNRIGYGFAKGDTYQCYPINGNETNGRNDFIPLTMSTPVSEPKRDNGSWYDNGVNRNHRNSSSRGFNHYRNNYHNSSKSHFNNSYSPYKNNGNKQFGQKKGYQKGVHRQVDISRYIDVKSFLEDPWAELTRKLNNSKESEDKDIANAELSDSSVRDSKQNLEITSSVDSSHKELQLSQESKNDSFVEIDDTELSQVSKTDSSLDLGLSDIKFSQESRNESMSSSNDSVSDARESVTSCFNDSEIQIDQKDI